MPRKAKDEDLIEDKKTKTTKKASSSKKTTTSKKTKSTKEPVKKAVKKDAVKEDKKIVKKVAKKASTTSKKASPKKVESKTVKKVTSKKTVVKKEEKPKKEVTKKTTSKKKTEVKTTKATKKITTKKTTAKKATSKKVANKNKPEIIEYYDLPYTYNKTVIKLLAQTPTTLFVYWEISNKDKEDFINKYGEFFFNNTKPVLIIHNKTLNYSYELDINDFANCWYIHVNDANCDYEIELGRRGINEYISLDNNYLFISNSNEIESPNDHILFEKLPSKLLFKNVKTNETFEKATFYYLKKIKSTYNVKDFYKKMFKDEFDFDKLTLKNPSSLTSSY